MKAFNLPLDYVLYDMSYANMIMYGAVLPSYKSSKKNETGKAVGNEKINADDPRNKDKVRSILFGE